MNERGIEVKVGILVTICLGLLVAFIVLLGDFGFGDGGVIYLDVPTSADLKSGAPVKIAGVPAGRVQEVAYWGGRVDEQTGKRVVVRAKLSIDPQRLPTIKRDARFYITTQGVLGEKYVEIDPGSAQSPALEPGAVVDGQPPLRLEQMAMNASQLVSSLNRLVQDNEAQIGEIITNANDTVKTVKKAVERVDAMIARTEPKVAKVLDDLDKIEAEAQTLLVSANTAIGDGTAVRRTIANVEAVSGEARGQIKPVVKDVRDTLARFRAVADTGREAVADARGGVMGLLGKAGVILDDVRGMTRDIAAGKGTIGALLGDREMYDDIREMMKDLKRHPWKFLWKD